jgi:hypothetical protein
VFPPWTWHDEVVATAYICTVLLAWLLTIMASQSWLTLTLGTQSLGVKGSGKLWY